MQHQMQVKFWIRSVLQRTHTRFSLKALKVCFYRIFWPVFIFFIFANLKPVFLIKAIRLDSEQHKAFITAGLDQSERLNLLLTFFFFFLALLLCFYLVQRCKRVQRCENPERKYAQGVPLSFFRVETRLAHFPHTWLSPVPDPLLLSQGGLCASLHISACCILWYTGASRCPKRT